LPTLERERLLGGNWEIRPAAGLYFKHEWCAIVDEVPADLAKSDGIDGLIAALNRKADILTGSTAKSF